MTEEKQDAYPDAVDEKAALNATNESEKEADGSLVDFDSSKVKFINGGADANVDIERQKKTGAEFAGLSKEELMKYANDPYWVKVRWGMLILFWVAWFAMLAAAIVIIVLAPKCPHRPEQQWWEKAVAYQVYPRSFKDSNGDGVGDLKGVESKLDYLRQKLNVTAVRLNPIYESPLKDSGYDVSDHKAIHPLFGDLEDFHRLRAAMHHRGMKLILDFVPNHTSKNHTWFLESRKNNNEDNEYRDYYVWHKSGPSTPPNNWLSVYGGPAWTFDPQRGEWYLHQFSPEQPDLNLRNAKVQEELKDILTFWLQKGVDGFHVEAAAHLFETPIITDDEQPSGKRGLNAGHYDTLDHTLTTFQPETYELITQWRSLLDAVSKETETYRFLSVNAEGNPGQLAAFYSHNDTRGVDVVYNTNLLGLKTGCGGECVLKLVDAWASHMPAGKGTTWLLGSPDVSRVASRMGVKYVNAAHMLALLLPGTVTSYYGEEIGMLDGKISFAQTVDLLGKNKGQALYAQYSRDPERTPMQWSDEVNAGFSTADKTWLPVNPDYRDHNVQVQLAHGAGKSILEVYAELTLLRQNPSFQWGAFHYAVTNNSVFSFIRAAEGFPGYLVAINLGPQTETSDFHAAMPTKVPDMGTIVASTSNFDYNRAHDFEVGLKVHLDNIYLRPTEGVVFCWQPGAVKSD